MTVQFKHFKFPVIFTAVVVADQLTKSASAHLRASFGAFSLEPHVNPGLFLHWLSQESEWIRIIFVSSFYGLLLFLYLFGMKLISAKHRATKTSLTLLMASMTGNLIDRVFSGTVRDFICFQWGSRLFYGNLADLVMWVSVASLAYTGWANRDVFFPAKNDRKVRVLLRSYQYNWAYKAAIVSFCSFLTFLMFACTYFHASQDLEFLVTGFVLALFFAAASGVAAIRFSHRSAGPLHAFEKHVEQLLSGNLSEEFQLREGDEHQHLVSVAKKLKEKLTEMRDCA